MHENDGGATCLTQTNKLPYQSNDVENETHELKERESSLLSELFEKKLFTSLLRTSDEKGGSLCACVRHH